jgi:hypothetical protein
MTRNRLIGLAALSILLNFWQAWKIRELGLATRFVTLDPETTADESTQLESVEKLSFLRELATRWSTFQSSSYLSSQASLLPWLSPELAEQRKAEIQRLSKKMRHDSVEQSAKIREIIQTAENQFVALAELTLIENRIESRLWVEHRIEIEKTSRSAENVWGLRAARFETATRETPAARKDLTIAHEPLLIQFPCQIRSLSEPGANTLKMKVVTMRMSDLSITPAGELGSPVSLTATCERREFSFELKPGSPAVRLYSVDDSEGRPVTAKSARQAGPQRDWVKRSLEKELGFEVEESDK